MGGGVSIALYADSPARAGELFDAAFDEIERVEANLSSYRDTSEVMRLNRRAGHEAVTTDPETFALLERAREYSARSAGAFDITVGSLLTAWGFFRGEGRLPAAGELEEARRQSGWRELHLDDGARTVRFGRAGLKLDFGAIGKGYALDRAAAVLTDHGVVSALLGAGPSTWVAVGAPRNAPGWSIRVPHPVDRGTVISSIELRDAALSTSGSYEKFFELDGAVYCHIIDPRSGHPVSGMLQVTVVAASGETSDVLSTAAFVTGWPAAESLLAGERARAALIVTGDDRQHETFNWNWPQPGGNR